jgi:hypothetical protein
MYIDNYYIEKLTNFKYPEAVSQYGVTEKATKELIKRFKKKLDLNDILEILEYNKRNNYDEKIISVIMNLYNDLSLVFKRNDLERASKAFYNINDFIKFVNTISNAEIFGGYDLEKNWKWNMKFEDLLNCRSYKIYIITNG